MAEKYSFFNSIESDRRKYDASDFASFFSTFFTNGIFNNSLQVIANDNMTVTVQTGDANINGYRYSLTEDLTLDVTEADSSLSRIDSVILRLDLSNRKINAQIIEGEYATTPVAPAITKTTNIYDLRLANISVSANATRITTSEIEDTRFTDDCGNVVSTVQTLSTEDIFNQYESLFNDWFDSVKDQLSTIDVAKVQEELNTTNENLATTNTNISTNYINHNVSRITEDNDFDDYTSQGEYTVWVNDESNSITNAPNTDFKYGKLIVTKSYSGVWQHAISTGGVNYSSEEYKRCNVNNDGWSEWIKTSTEVKPYCQAYASTSKTLSTSFVNKPLDTFSINSDSSVFEISNNGIKCNKKGVISISVIEDIINLTSNDDVGFEIKKNSTPIYNYWLKLAKTDYYLLGTTFTEVETGDIIYIQYRNATSARGKTNTTKYFGISIVYL